MNTTDIEEKNVSFDSFPIFWLTGWLAVLLITWLLRRSDYQPWAWTLVTSRWGNPGLHVAPGPSMLGDILLFENYHHLLADVKTSFLTGNLELFGVKMLYIIMIENLVFIRVCSTLKFLRNACYLLMYVSVIIINTSIFNAIIEHETAGGIPDSEELTTLLTMVDLIKTGYIIIRPEVLMPSNMGEAIFINITLLARMFISDLR